MLRCTKPFLPVSAVLRETVSQHDDSGRVNVIVTVELSHALLVVVAAAAVARAAVGNCCAAMGACPASPSLGIGIGTEHKEQ
jgi:hypothetical protein